MLRKKHQLLTTLKKANETVDIQYDQVRNSRQRPSCSLIMRQEWKRFDEFADVVKATQKHLMDYKASSAFFVCFRLRMFLVAESTYGSDGDRDCAVGVLGIHLRHGEVRIGLKCRDV